MVNTLALMGLRWWLEKNPELHDQRQWAVFPAVTYRSSLATDIINKRVPITCATAACAAGATVLLNGATINYLVAETNHFDQVVRYRMGTVTWNGKCYNTPDLAREMLGISEELAGSLFSPGLKYREVMEALDKLIAGVPERDVDRWLMRTVFI